MSSAALAFPAKKEELGSGRQYIETVPRVGYRFIASLSETPREDLAGSVLPAPDLSAIAVLPFADMSPCRDQDYLCEGLAEELINALTHVDGLRVASRTASSQFRATGADVREVGRQLGVGTLLEGSVRKADDRLRVTVQLVETAAGYPPVVAALRSQARRRLCDPRRNRRNRGDVPARERFKRA